MKVKELINQLKTFNPNADVGIKTLDDEYKDELYISYICVDPNGKDLNESETLQVWIEATDLCMKCEFFSYVDNECLAYDCRTNEVEECYQFEEKEDAD